MHSSASNFMEPSSLTPRLDDVVATPSNALYVTREPLPSVIAVSTTSSSLYLSSGLVPSGISLFAMSKRLVINKRNSGVKQSRNISTASRLESSGGSFCNFLTSTLNPRLSAIRSLKSVAAIRLFSRHIFCSALSEPRSMSHASTYDSISSFLNFAQTSPS